MAEISKRPVMLDVLEDMGIKIDGLTDITVHVGVDEPMTVTTVRYIRDIDYVKSLKTVVEKYELTKKEQALPKDLNA